MHTEKFRSRSHQRKFRALSKISRTSKYWYVFILKNSRKLSSLFSTKNPRTFADEDQNSGQQIPKAQRGSTARSLEKTGAGGSSFYDVIDRSNSSWLICKHEPLLEKCKWFRNEDTFVRRTRSMKIVYKILDNILFSSITDFFCFILYVCEFYWIFPLYTVTMTMLLMENYEAQIIATFVKAT